MAELKMTHVLLLAVAAFLLYHSMSGCGFNRGDGFNVGGQVIITESCGNNLSNNCSNQNIISNNQLVLNEQLNDVESHLTDVLNYLSDFKYNGGIKCNNLPPI